MSSTLTAPRVDAYLEHLGRIHYRAVDSDYTYDDRSYILLDEIFSLLKQIKPNGKNGLIELWFRADRGPIEDYGDYDDMKEWNGYETYDEFVEEWKAYYPEEEKWYAFSALEDEGYRAIFLGHRHVIEQDSRKTRKSFPDDISDFCEWILVSLRKCIEDLQNGTYNSYVREHLPPIHRTGTITRKALWDVYPEYRKKFFQDLCREDVDDFIRYVSEEETMPVNRLPEMTANRFYECCALGYRANNYNGCDLPPREQYDLHADGRDDGLSEIDADSPEAFAEWMNNKRYGGHPWEVCRGGNSTHISLYVLLDDSGYSFSLAGDAETRTVESVKFYLALRREGLPVTMQNGSRLVDRLLEKEKIGIVPEGVFPRYCHSMFPGDDVIDFMNLSEVDPDLTAQYCVWQEIKDVELI